MADTTILNGDIGVTWFTNNRNKRLEWIGGTNDTYTMNQIYSAMQTLQDETTTIDDGTCFSAETPTEYTVGKIDQGDNDPWYITFELMEHVTAGALKTAGWARVQDSNTGVVVVPVDSGGAITKSDEGSDIAHSDGDAGTLLEFIDTGTAIDYCVIRPDSDAIGNSFDAASTDTLTANANVANVQAVATTGDQVWANIYTIGTVEPSVHMYIYQGAALTADARARVFSWNSATLDWYPSGHIDTTVPLKDITAATWTIIDGGYLNVYARKGGDLYASFEVENSTTSGGRNPVPLQTSVDLDQGHGTKSVSFTGAVTGTFTDGEIIRDGTTNGRGILDLTNSVVTSSGNLVYFPIAEDDGTGTTTGGALTAIGNGNTVTGASSSASVTTNGAPTNDGPALSTWFTSNTFPDLILGDSNITGYGGVNLDIDNDTTNEEYGVLIDCNSNPLSEVYQWVKFITQYGQGDTDVVEQAFTDDFTQADIYGEEFTGATAYIQYTGGSTPANIIEGESVTQAVSGATGVVLWHDSTAMRVLLRSTRGTFNANTINADDDGSTWTTVTASNFAAKVASPFGTFAGGTFFGARGVLITEWTGADANSFILTDATGSTFQRPTSLTFKITNLVGGAETSNEHDRVSMFRLTGSGGDINKDQFSGCTAGAAGDADLDVGATIANVPDSGSLVIVQDPGLATAVEYKIRYSSYTGQIFTLANYTFDPVATTNTTQITVASGFSANVKRGDLVYNTTRTAYSYVKTVDSDTQITIDPAIASQTDTDTIEINALPVAVDTGDDMYVPYIDKMATTDEESASFIDPEVAIFYRVKVRNTRNTTTKIKPYSSDGNVTSADATVQITRTEDTVIT